MKKTLLLFCTIPLFCMEQEEKNRDRKGSITVTIDRGYKKKHRAAYKLAHSALNGHTDEHIVNAIGYALEKDREGLLYQKMPQKRAKAKKAVSDKAINQEKAVRYIIKELLEQKEEKEKEAASQSKKKYTVALIGAATTLISTITTALAMYFNQDSAE